MQVTLLAEEKALVAAVQTIRSDLFLLELRVLEKTTRATTRPRATKIAGIEKRKHHLKWCFLVCAETQGFEPWRAFTPYLVSSEALSTTQPTLQMYKVHLESWLGSKQVSSSYCLVNIGNFAHKFANRTKHKAVYVLSTQPYQ